MEYVPSDGIATCMVRDRHKLENYSFGIEQLEEELGNEFKRGVVNETYVAMRNWPQSEGSGKP